MLDRSRMALCAFTFLFLSLNPLAALLCGSTGAGDGVGDNGDASPHSTGRNMLGLTGRLPTPGKKPERGCRAVAPGQAVHLGSTEIG